MPSTNKIVLAITSVKDSRGEVANGGTTPDTSLQLSGQAAIGDRVKIFDGSVEKGQVGVTGPGNWSFQLTGLTIGTHKVTAKNETGVSTPRSFVVTAS